MTDDDFIVITTEEYEEGLRVALYELGMTPKQFLAHVADCNCCFDDVSPSVEARMHDIWFSYRELIREWAA